MSFPCFSFERLFNAQVANSHPASVAALQCIDAPVHDTLLSVTILSQAPTFSASANGFIQLQDESSTHASSLGSKGGPGE
jgi:hypothetical protein